MRFAPSSLPRLDPRLQERLTSLLVLLSLIAAALTFAAAPALASDWLRRPFLGALYENTLVFNTTSPASSEGWALHRQLSGGGYQLKTLDGQAVTSAQEAAQILSARTTGSLVEVGLEKDGQPLSLSTPLEAFSTRDVFLHIILPYLIGLIYCASGLYVFIVRRGDGAGRAFALFAAAASISLAGMFDAYTTHRLAYLWTFAIALTGGALLNLAFLFPQETGLVARYPWLRWSGYLPSVLLTGLSFPALFNFQRPFAYAQAWRFSYVYIGLAGLFFVASTVYRRVKSPSPMVRDQSRLILLGATGFLPLVAWLLANAVYPGLPFWPVLLLPIAIFPLAVGYAILRYRLLNTDVLLNRAILYAILTFVAAGGYALIVSGLTLIFGAAFNPTNPIVVGLVVFALALLLDPARSRLQTLVDTVFFRGGVIYRNRLQVFARELTRALDLPQIAGLLRQFAHQDLLPARLHIFIHDALTDHYLPIPEADGKPGSDLRFPPSSPLAGLLGRGPGAIYFEDPAAHPDLGADAARLALLACPLFLPLLGRAGLIGWLAIGPRASGEPYDSRSIHYLESLCSQAALAIERAQVVADLQRQVQAMNVLSRVAQGANVTVAFDDLLELIYAQASQVIPTRDFRVSLFDEHTTFLTHAFYLEDDERLSERENQPLPSGQGLIYEVVANQMAIITEDFERECRSRGLLPDARGLFAWMAVPLNAGATTIGAISLGSRDPATIYTSEQRNLLQAIADQASGAIVKARLLQESEYRAHQLATLNEIGRSLTSTLELQPLLNQILQSAAEILNCQAGSLLLVDESTGELVFEVVIGPVAETLQGKRLPPGKGLVGQAVTSGRAIIANDAKRRKEWLETPDRQTGFDTQDLLVVPMLLGERVIGVIEVINKADGAPFTQNDQELLVTFTSQATIAIENARLYTMTDQALAARVEELSVMQRIDRELNASLESDRAMRITLDWAMRQSQADAGLIGMVEAGGLRVMASTGYANGIERSIAPDALLPLDLPGLSRAIDSGLPQNLDLTGGAATIRPPLPSDAAQNPASSPDDDARLLTEAVGQVVIPIKREASVGGVLLLESRRESKLADDVMAFLSRLSDHAAIAIANAQLYGEVRAANLAKSKFVSFVAHELKNPMTVIKGNTELVASGVAGPVTDLQSSFLGTVRTNVDRMNTIVSDLNDLTKLEVGSLRLEYKSINVGESIEEVLRSMKRQIEVKEQKLALSLPADLPAVWCDPNRLVQVLTNLVSNAHKYTGQGGAIRVGAERCLAASLTAAQGGQSASAQGEVVHIWVQDSGIGIPADDQAKIFQSYFRTEISKDTASGTGLGLHITRSLVEMQGGRIWFESQVGAGTIFHFTVPVVEVA